VVSLEDPNRAKLIYAILGSDSSPSAAIERIRAVSMDSDNYCIVESYPDGFGIDFHKVGIISHLFGVSIFDRSGSLEEVHFRVP
jgi:hypothetical protein